MTADGTLIGYSLYEYDSSGKPVQGTDFYEPDGALEDTIPSTPMTRMEQNQISYRANGGVAYFGTTYTYDESGNMVQMENWGSPEKTVTYIQYE